MIEVLSKVWDRDKGEWLSDRHSTLGNGRLMIEIGGKEWYEFEIGNRFMMSNYSGVDDASNKKVYDGHIIRFNYGKKPVVVVTAPVVFVNSGFYALTPSETPSMYLIADLKSNGIRFDIVGNVFENPNTLNSWNSKR